MTYAFCSHALAVGPRRSMSALLRSSVRRCALDFKAISPANRLTKRLYSLTHSPNNIMPLRFTAPKLLAASSICLVSGYTYYNYRRSLPQSPRSAESHSSASIVTRFRGMCTCR